ncbi:TPA: ATP-binding protein [Escherichia coli]|uniref:ATP-binding protein n=5 Tax=Escherichia coli TaxID=562 RepID=A0A5C8XWS5_ECOLX|nr:MULTISPECIES: ATP-binding protein [Escherichia]EAB6574992.1 ATP-binding protein [Salmonella enterica subsp. enterica]EBK0574591.1 ATP-binding protein [Salmonella enterica]EDS7712082.1 ATP-binding protein [Salmonella enterica subsp. enterica serovar Oranienburg]EFA8612504.1 ATP-binding protein [Escherichia coli O18:H7]EFY4970775.1 ATP-binding protein [Shigella flexneri]EHN2282911.1 ATP-binding protein [Shigella sonnei]HCM4673310.1 ATP-binding protein [Salmonella enterica subsp. enterica se
MTTNEILSQLISLGLKGDKVAFVRQASKLARSYDSMGLPELASAIRGSIQDKNTFNLQKVSRSTSPIFERLDTLPVDKETKFDLADVTQPSSEIQLPLLKDSTLKKIKEFLTFTERAKELKDAGLGVTSSMILYGPPGCGKTLTSKYIASCLNLPLLTARCDSLVSSYLGSTSKNIRQLFEYASKAPCVLFLDELDSLAKARDDQHELGELKRVVVSLLQNIDNLPEETILIAASNHENLLDSAVWRRFEYRISIGLPDFEVRKQLFEQYSNIKATYDDFVDDLAEISSGLNCSFIEQCCLRSERHALVYNNKQIDTRFLVEAILEAKGVTFDEEDNLLIKIVTTLREYNPKRFTIRKIAKILGLSNAKVSRLTKNYREIL